MKTKAYKLAAELGIGEQSVLDWLRSNGYPNVRRADTIRSDVAQAARRALGRARAARRQRNTGAQRVAGAAGAASAAGAQRAAAGGGRPNRNSEGFRVSFADLLEGHLPQAPADAMSANPTSPGLPVVTPPNRPSNRNSGSMAAIDALRLQLARAEAERDQTRRELEILKQRMEADAVRLTEARSALAAMDGQRLALEQLRTDQDRVLLERATLRQALQAAEDERATLADACAELQDELRALRDNLEGVDAERDAKQEVVADLESAMQREMAWRTRALELERVVQMGNSLPGLLQGMGVDDLRTQAAVLSALLSDRDGAVGLIRAIKQIDAAALEKMIAGRIVRVCADPICSQVGRLDERLLVRVDAASQCEVCHGEEDTRWFQRMVRECARSGVRRLLVIGGRAGTHKALRELSQGQRVDLRLVPNDEDLHEARIRGRVEGCDVVVTWAPQLVPPALTAAYQAAAERESTQVVNVLGPVSSVHALARAVCNRLARNHILVAV